MMIQKVITKKEAEKFLIKFFYYLLKKMTKKSLIKRLFRLDPLKHVVLKE